MKKKTITLMATLVFVLGITVATDTTEKQGSAANKVTVAYKPGEGGGGGD